MRGKFAVLEGVDASGKQTQSKILAEALGARLFSFPRYETELGRAILGNLKGEWGAYGRTTDDQNRHVWRHGDETLDERKLNALVLQSLMTIDRYDVATEIEALLAAGTNVVADRYWASGYVYGVVDGLNEAWLRRIHARLPEPDCWVLLDVEPEEAARRRPEKRDRFERDEKMALRRQLYLNLFRHQAKCGEPWRMVSSAGSIADVAREVRRTVEAMCGGRS